MAIDNLISQILVILSEHDLSNDQVDCGETWQVDVFHDADHEYGGVLPNWWSFDRVLWID